MSPNSKGVEILSIGTELLLGNIINTNAQWISEQLSLLGLNHFRQSTVGDNCERIIKVIQEISKRSNLLITTGGLGPTPDDLTTEAIAKSFNVNLFERPHLWDEIKQKLPNSKLKDHSSSLKKQSFFPKNAQIINNPRGTAPGMIWEPIEGFTILTFPGVPSEMKTMWEETAYDFIKTKFSDGYSFFSNTLKFAGIGESSVAEKINDLLNLKNPTVAPYANLGEVKIRITARAKNDLEAKNIIKPVKEKLKKEFSNFIIGKKSFSLGLQIISNKEIASMNKKWMQKNDPTDVLSFPIISDESLNNLEYIELGDIFISLEMALEQSYEYKHSIYKEMIWLASHGFLHLLGWEHNNEHDLENMLNFQEYLISRLD